MEVRRIGPHAGFVNHVVEIEERVKSLETKPSGSIVIRENNSITTTDPATGVETIFGQLPDGSVGIQPFVGDVTPPPVATAPTASTQPGSVVVSWDGLFVADEEQPRDFEHLNVIAHKLESGSTVLSIEAGVIRLAAESLIITTDILGVGEEWQFSFESEDYNGNLSAQSARSSVVTVLSLLDDDAVTQAISDLNNDIYTAQSTADGKNTIHYLDTAPAGVGHRQNDIWFDTDNDNRLSLWNATTEDWELSLLGNDAILANLDAGKITVGELSALRLKAKSVTIDKLLVTSTDNIIQEGDFSGEGVSWELPSGFVINPIAGRNSVPAMMIMNTATLQTSYNAVGDPVKVPIEYQSEEGNSYRISGWLKSSVSVPVSGVYISARFKSVSGTYTEKKVIYSNSQPASAWTIPALTYTEISDMVTAPLGTVSVAFSINSAASLSTGIVTWDSVTVTRAANGRLIVDGSITTYKLESELVLATKIIAGTPSGRRATMEPSGFHVYADDGSEAIKLGTGDDDYFGVLKPDGTYAASITNDGNASVNTLHVQGGLWYKGQDLYDKIDSGPRGLVGWGAQYSNPPSTSAQMGVFEISVRLYAGRMYKIHTSPIRIYSNTADMKSSLRVRYTTDATGTPVTPGVGSAVMAQSEIIFPKADDYQSNMINKILNVGADANFRMLLVYSADNTGATQMFGSNDFPIEMWVEDIGPYTGNLQIANQGAGTPNSPAPQTKVDTWDATGIMSYYSNNTQYMNNYMYQGLSPAVGNVHSLATFPDVTGTLSGATINNVRVYFNFLHWYYNSGGTAHIGVHGHASGSIPSTFAPPGAQRSISGWPKPGAQWIDLPIGIWNNFKTGATRGVSLQGDGTLGTYGYAAPPRLEITYTK